MQDDGEGEGKGEVKGKGREKWCQIIRSQAGQRKTSVIEAKDSRGEKEYDGERPGFSVGAVGTWPSQ